MPLPDLEVVRVVRRGDLDHPGAEGGVDVRIGDDRNASAGQRKFHFGADQVGVPIVVRVYRDRRVAEHRLRAGRRDDYLAGRRVAVPDRDQLALVVGVLHLDVRQCGGIERTS